MVQLRDRERPARERLEIGRELGEVARDSGQLFQVNDRLDLAVLLHADAVHLGEASMATADARSLVGSRVLITRACHDVARVAEVASDGVVLSPILEARKGRAALGTAVLQNARARLDAMGPSAPRLVALGGVNGVSARLCFDAGADAVAVVGAWLTDRVEGLLEGVGIQLA
jgi:thiamine-phosphate pyrophosphorylase